MRESHAQVYVGAALRRGAGNARGWRSIVSAGQALLASQMGAGLKLRMLLRPARFAS
jgi:hypothetical protein